MNALLAVLGRVLFAKLLGGAGVPLPVRSHVIHDAAYDLTGTLTLTFDSGTYSYNVDPATAAGLCTASSPISYFNRHIK